MKFQIEPKKNPFRTVTPGKYRMRVESFKELMVADSKTGKESAAIRVFLRGLDGEAKDVLFQTQFLEDEPSYVSYFAVALRPELADQENAEFAIDDSIIGLELVGEVKNIEQNNKWVNRIIRYSSVPKVA